MIVKIKIEVPHSFSSWVFKESKLKNAIHAEILTQSLEKFKVPVKVLLENDSCIPYKGKNYFAYEIKEMTLTYYADQDIKLDDTVELSRPWPMNRLYELGFKEGEYLAKVFDKNDGTTCTEILKMHKTANGNLLGACGGSFLFDLRHKVLLSYRKMQ